MVVFAHGCEPPTSQLSLRVDDFYIFASCSFSTCSHFLSLPLSCLKSVLPTTAAVILQFLDLAPLPTTAGNARRAVKTVDVHNSGSILSELWVFWVCSRPIAS